MYKIIITSTNDERFATQIRDVALLKKLSPCIHLIKDVESSYLWKDKINKDKEILIMIKCKEKNVALIKEHIKETHNYETPEIILIDFDILSKEYKIWFDSASK